MSLPRAVLWDVDGTMAETERDGHRVAFNQAFEELGMPWRWSVERYRELLAVAGGRERVLHDLPNHEGVPASTSEREALALALHTAKDRWYARLIAAGRIPLRGGVLDLLRECRERGVRMAITTTTTTTNVGALLRLHLGDDWASWFEVTVCGEHVRRKKPDPEVYERACALLRLAPGDVVAIEDAPAGVASALWAQVPVIGTRSVYFADVPLEGALAVGPGLDARDGWSPPVAPSTRGGIGLDDIATWRAEAD